MACKKSVFNIKENKFVDLSDIQQKLTASLQASFYEVTAQFIEIGNPKALRDAKKILKNDPYIFSTESSEPIFA